MTPPDKPHVPESEVPAPHPDTSAIRSIPRAPAVPRLLDPAETPTASDSPEARRIRKIVHDVVSVAIGELEGRLELRAAQIEERLAGTIVSALLERMGHLGLANTVTQAQWQLHDDRLDDHAMRLMRLEERLRPTEPAPPLDAE